MRKSVFGGRILVLGFLSILISGLSAQEHETPDVDVVEAPELIALTWAIAPDSENVAEIEFWSPDGEPLNGLYRNEILSELAPKDFIANLPEGDRLRPLVMIYRVAENAPPAAVRPMMTNDGVAIAGSLNEMPQSESGFAVSILGPLTTNHADWPESVDLTIRYAPSKPVTKTLKEDLLARQEVMDGVWAGMMPMAGNLHYVFENRINSEPMPKAFYEYSVEFDNGQIEEPKTVFVKQAGDGRYLCRSTESIQPDSLKSISVTKLVFAYEQIGKIRIPTDSLDQQ